MNRNLHTQMMFPDLQEVEKNGPTHERSFIPLVRNIFSLTPSRWGVRHENNKVIMSKGASVDSRSEEATEDELAHDGSTQDDPSASSGSTGVKFAKSVAAHVAGGLVVAGMVIAAKKGWHVISALSKKNTKKTLTMRASSFRLRSLPHGAPSSRR